MLTYFVERDIGYDPSKFQCSRLSGSYFTEEGCGVENTHPQCCNEIKILSSWTLLFNASSLLLIHFFLCKLSVCVMRNFYARVDTMATLSFLLHYLCCTEYEFYLLSNNKFLKACLCCHGDNSSIGVIHQNKISSEISIVCISHVVAHQ